MNATTFRTIKSREDRDEFLGSCPNMGYDILRELAEELLTIRGRNVEQVLASRKRKREEMRVGETKNAKRYVPLRWDLVEEWLRRPKDQGGMEMNALSVGQYGSIYSFWQNQFNGMNETRQLAAHAADPLLYFLRNGEVVDSLVQSAYDEGKYKASTIHDKVKFLSLLRDHWPGIGEVVTDEAQDKLKEVTYKWEATAVEHLKDNEPTMEYSEWKKRIEEHFGMDSPQALFAAVMLECPVRNDTNMKIVRSKEEAGEVNVVIVPEDERQLCSYKIRESKSMKNNEDNNYITESQFSEELSARIRKYVATRPGWEYLFFRTKPKMTKFRRDMNEAIGCSKEVKSINTIRRMLAVHSDTHHTLEEKVEFSRKMLHSYPTHRNVYLAKK